MSLPPEQINIKRRREEEPVDTLYIQSELHQTKRRFTDFVFQRVPVTGGGPDGKTPTTAGGGAGAGSPSPSMAQQRPIRTPRSVSSVNFPTSKPAAGGGGFGSGVPMVRATSPGAEFREERRLAAAKREHEEKLKRALNSAPSPSSPARAQKDGPGARVEDRSDGDGDVDDEATAAAADSATSSGRGSPASSASPGMRRFQISRSRSLLRSTTGGGVQKRKGDGAVAVLVEKLRRKPHSRQASMVADAAVRTGDVTAAQAAAAITTAAAAGTTTAAAAASSSPSSRDSSVSRPRKRPVVNQAEKQWREERKTAISAAKHHITQVLEKEAQAQHQSNWEDESERLAREFEQIALELEGGRMDEDGKEDEVTPSAHQHHRGLRSQSDDGRRAPVMPKPALKYQPRTPNKHRAAGTAETKQGREEEPAAKIKPTPQPALDAEAGGQEEGDEDNDSDGSEYVYDTYIRRPLPETEGVSNPLSDWQQSDRGQENWFRQQGIDTTRPDVGVIVITQEDEEYWEKFVEEDDDEDRWDSEDGDSNAENNPANDYPDEDLSWDDEDDDPAAVYSKYRQHGVSDDEEFDLDDSASERWQHRSHMDSDDDDKSW